MGFGKILSNLYAKVRNSRDRHSKTAFKLVLLRAKKLSARLLRWKQLRNFLLKTFTGVCGWLPRGDS